MNDKPRPYGEVLDEMDHDAKYKSPMADTWRGLETAPKDGTRILATWDYEVRIENPVIVRWMADHWKGAGWYTDQAGTPYHVTHWQPLPPPPAPEGK